MEEETLREVSFLGWLPDCCDGIHFTLSLLSVCKDNHNNKNNRLPKHIRTWGNMMIFIEKGPDRNKDCCREDFCMYFSRGMDCIMKRLEHLQLLMMMTCHFFTEVITQKACIMHQSRGESSKRNSAGMRNSADDDDDMMMVVGCGEPASGIFLLDGAFSILLLLLKNAAVLVRFLLASKLEGKGKK